MVQKNLVTTESLGYERQCNTYCTNHFSQWNLSTPNKKFTRSKQGAWSMIHKFKSSPVFPQPLHVSKQGAPEHVDYSQHDALQTVYCVFLKPLSGRPTLHFFTALVTHALNVFSRGTFANPESVKAARSHWFPKILISPPGHSSCSFMIFPRSIRLHIAWVNFLRFFGWKQVTKHRSGRCTILHHTLAKQVSGYWKYFGFAISPLLPPMGRQRKGCDICCVNLIVVVLCGTC